MAADASGSGGANAPRLEGEDVLRPVRGRETDPTLMRNQPALRRSAGTVWLVTGTIFTAIALIVFAAFVSSQPVVAWAGIGLVGALYIAMLVTRFVVTDHGRRLLILASLLIAIAGVSLICTLVITAQEWAAFT